MSQQEKLIERFKSKPKDFRWEELTKLLKGFGYNLLPTGKTGGSRRRFYHESGDFISLHEPHPRKILKRYQIDIVLEKLKNEGLL